MNPATWTESPAQKIDRLTRSESDALALCCALQAKLTESRRQWGCLFWAVCCVALTNTAVLLGIALLLRQIGANQ